MRRGPPLLIGSNTNGAISIQPDNTTLAVGKNYQYAGVGDGRIRGRTVRHAHRRAGPISPPQHSNSSCSFYIVFTGRRGNCSRRQQRACTVYDAATGEPRRRITGGNVHVAQIGSNGMVLACGRGASALFEPSTGAGWSTYQRRWREVTYSFSTASFSLDSRMLAVGGHGPGILILDTATISSRRLGGARAPVDARAEERRRLGPLEKRCDTLAFSPDSATIALGYRNVVGLYDCATGALQQECLERDNQDNYVLAVAFSSAGRLLFTAKCQHLVTPYYATDEGLRRRDLDCLGLGAEIRQTEFSRDASLLALVGHNNSVALYDVATGEQRLTPRRAPAPPQTDH